MGYNDSSLVTPLPTSCYLIEKDAIFWRGKISIYINFFFIFQEHPEYIEAVFQYLKAKIK